MFSASPCADYELRISVTADRSHILVDLWTSNRGEESLGGRVHFPFDPWEVDKTLRMASHASGRYITRSARADSLDQLKELGDRLFTALFEGRRRSLYDRAVNAAKDEESALRLRFITGDDELDWIPWEFLFDARRPDFVGLSANTPIVRQALTPSQFSPLPPLEGPIRALVVVSDPLGNLEADREVIQLQQLASANHGRFQLDLLEHPRREELLSTLRQRDFEVLHIVSNVVDAGPYGGELLSLAGPGQQDATSRIDPQDAITPEDLRDILARKPKVRFVMFNACNTQRFAQRISRVVPAALGMRSSVTNDACEIVTTRMYQSLLQGSPVDAALTHVRQQIDRSLSGSREWGLISLYLQAADGSILQSDGKASSSAEGRLLDGLGAESPDRNLAKVQLRLAVLKQNRQALAQEIKSFQDPPESLRSQLRHLEEEIQKFESGE